MLASAELRGLRILASAIPPAAMYWHLWSMPLIMDDDMSGSLVEAKRDV